MTTKIHFRKLFALRYIFALAIASSCSTESEYLPAGFEIEHGFNLTLVASEPLITDPVDLEFRENGDAMVLEMPGYPLGDEQSRLVVLKDNDKDGKFDERILFADNLQQGTSVLPYKEGAIVAAPPYMLYLADENGDDRADRVDTLMGGFPNGNLQHNFNGLTYGIDNWIYAANGGNSGAPYWWHDTTSVMNLRGHDFRFNPEKRIMQRIGRSSGGFEMGMDEWGHLFETHNLHHLSHLVFQHRYIGDVKLMCDHSLVNISDHEENGLARIYPIGEQESRVNHPEQSGYFSGSCGITYYGGGTFGPEYDNTVWVADVVLNLIHVDKIHPAGSSFAASRMLQKKDFIASSDRSFRPVNLAVGPDGTLYVVDMYRKVIEHPEWIPDEIEKNLDLNAGKDKGRIYRISKRDSESHAFDPAIFQTIESQIIALKHPNQWMRMTAQRLLMDHELSGAQIVQLTDLLRAESPWTRVHALWLLNAKGKLTDDHLAQMLNDSAIGVRENALIVSEQYVTTNETLLKKCLALIGDGDQRVSMQAALTISTLASDHFERYKEDVLSALTKLADRPLDEWNIYAVALASKFQPDELFMRLVRSNEANADIKLLSSLALMSGTETSNAKVVLQALFDHRVHENIKSEVIDWLSKGVPSNAPGNLLLPDIRNLEQAAEIKVISSLANLRKKIGLPPSPEFLEMSETALTSVLDKSLSDSVRAEQLTIIEFLPYAVKADVLFRCLHNTEPLNIQKEALRQLSTYDDPDIGRKLVSLWPELGPQTRRLAGDLLINKKIHHDALLTGLEKGQINIGEMNFDLERRRTLLWWADNDDIKRRAELFFSDAGVMTRREAFDKMHGALDLTGSSAKGAEVFQNVCSQCHIYGSRGEDVGPVLTEINRKSKESLMHDILDPNAAVDTRYINHRVETISGEVHIGIVDTETDQFIAIKKMGGATTTVNKNEIRSFTSLGTSLMMEGLEGSMTPQDMADLLAFLQAGKNN